MKFGAYQPREMINIVLAGWTDEIRGLSIAIDIAFEGFCSY